MYDRKMIKWQPFDAVINSNSIVKELSSEKENIQMPILSDDQVEKINNILSSSNNTLVRINYFRNNKSLEIIDVIENINIIKKRITTKSNLIIYLSQIIDLNYL